MTRRPGPTTRALVRAMPLLLAGACFEDRSLDPGTCRADIYQLERVRDRRVPIARGGGDTLQLSNFVLQTNGIAHLIVTTSADGQCGAATSCTEADSARYTVSGASIALDFFNSADDTGTIGGDSLVLRRAGVDDPFSPGAAPFLYRRICGR